MLQHLHDHRLNGWHLDEGKALLEQLLKLPISGRRLEQSTIAAKPVPSELCFVKSNTLPVLLLALCNGGNSLHQLVSQLVKHRLVELQPRSSMEVEEGQSGLQRWQQDAILYLQSCDTAHSSLAGAGELRDSCSFVMSDSRSNTIQNTWHGKSIFEKVLAHYAPHITAWYESVLAEEMMIHISYIVFLNLTGQDIIYKLLLVAFIHFLQVT